RDLRAVDRVDPVRILGVVDLREGLDLAGEHDREVLRRLLELAAERLLPRDLVELLAALARELHQHDRLVRVRVEVRARPGALQVVARQLGNLPYLARAALEARRP